MKRIAFLLLMVPMVGMAQTEKEENKLNDGILSLLHADKTQSVPPVKTEERKKLKNDTRYLGAVQFKIGGNLISCDSAFVHENENVVDAYNVTISNPNYFTVTGTKLVLNKETMAGEVSTDVKVTALNGSVIGTSDDIDVDLKTEAYRIGKGTIRPVENKQ